MHPMDNQKGRTINVAYCSNRNYLPFTIISMYSLLSVGRDDRSLKIFLAADQDITDEDLQPFYLMISKFPGCTFEVRWPANLTTRHFPRGEDCSISEEGIQPAYYRLLLPELLADEERCLYLDGDLVVTRSLTNLYDTPMEGMYLAGITDRLCLEEAQNERMLKAWGVEPGYYINAGVLLMDLGKMRSSGKYMEALELAYRKTFRYLDQDVVNQVYLGKIKLLPKVYQLFPDNSGGI